MAEFRTEFTENFRKNNELDKLFKNNMTVSIDELKKLVENLENFDKKNSNKNVKYE